MIEPAPLKPKQSALAAIRASRMKVTFYSPADLAETLKMAEQWHKANHLPAGEWAEEYAGYIFSRQGEEIRANQDNLIRNTILRILAPIPKPDIERIEATSLSGLEDAEKRAGWANGDDSF
jgi:hypothetical protein